MIRRYFRKINLHIRRLLYRFGYRVSSRIFYVVPGANWSVDWDGHYITEGINKQFGAQSALIHDARWLVNQVIHYGSLWTFLGNAGATHNKYNRVVVTVFHGDPEDKRFNFREGIQKFIAHRDVIDAVVVSNSIMEKRLRSWGIAREKIVHIPLGVDLSIFYPREESERRQTREHFGVPENAFCIGSFQKDGKGWEEGFEAKLVKGPDIFLDALEKLADENYRLFVLLSAPARGYIKRGLDQLGIPYNHIILEEYRDVARLFSALDAYLISSREEGGPKGVLEAMASGIPVISTKVGMVPNVVKHGHNGLLSENEDSLSLSRNIVNLMENPELAKKLAKNGLETIKAYDWLSISRRYYYDLYQPLIEASP